MQKTYRSIFISDVHLGTKDCQADKLNNFLKHNTCETLYLVGDIIDAWKIKQNKWRWKQSHTNVIRRVLGHSKRGTRVVYVAGNHDEFLRPFMQYGIGLGLIEVVNQVEHIGATTGIILWCMAICLMASLDWRHGWQCWETKHMISSLGSILGLIGFVIAWVLGTLALACSLNTGSKKQ
jgi:UDP-2,3-diacylglucosamine pyrophosphatase LpxH